MPPGSHDSYFDGHSLRDEINEIQRQIVNADIRLTLSSAQVMFWPMASHKLAIFAVAAS